MNLRVLPAVTFLFRTVRTGYYLKWSGKKSHVLFFHIQRTGAIVKWVILFMKQMLHF